MNGKNIEIVVLAGTNIFVDYTFGKKLGEGVYGRVVEAIHNKTNKIVAIKIINKSDFKKKNTHSVLSITDVFLKEAYILKLCKHPYIVEYIDCYENDMNFFLVMEYVKHGDLYSYIKKYSEKHSDGLNEYIVKKIVAQLLSALKCCHSNMFTHRDLKLENILLTYANKKKREEDIIIKLTDFGLANFININGGHKTKCGSVHYVAPEILQGDIYNPIMSDIWSVGVIIYALASGRFPWRLINETETIRDILNYDYAVIDTFSYYLKHLLSNIFIDVEKRYNLQDIENHPWIKGYVLPSYLPEIKQVEHINCKLVEKIISLGYNVGDIYTAIHNNIPGPITTIYHTLESKYIMDLQNGTIIFRRLKEDIIIKSDEESNSNTYKHTNTNTGIFKILSPRKFGKKKQLSVYSDNIDNVDKIYVELNSNPHKIKNKAIASPKLTLNLPLNSPSNSPSNSPNNSPRNSPRNSPIRSV
jgi:serine/threonine protein kinase